jgi:2'-5' RNA ligase
MRLFIAIIFDKSTSIAITKIRESVRLISNQGNFTQTANLHLTLAFLGDHDQKEILAIHQAMQKIDKHTVELHLEHLGSFAPKDNISKLIWVGIEPNSELNKLVYELRQSLTIESILFDKSEFVPHLTIGREVILQDKVQNIDALIRFEPIKFMPNYICLIESIRINNKLIYRELCRQYLL